MKNITVLLAEDHAVVRQGLRKLLEAESDIEVIGEAQTGREAVDLAKKLQPTVVVMDIAMPLLNGLEATRQILKTMPETKVFILSAHSDDAYVERATAVGAVGFLLKQSSSTELAKAIREVQKGNRSFSPAVAKRMNRQSTSNRRNQGKGIGRLSSRELEVLQLIAEGRPNKQVADELGISIKTVDNHRQNLMAKLDIHDTAGLTRYAISAGVIESSVQTTTL